jgi:TadE-like protein
MVEFALVLPLLALLLGMAVDFGRVFFGWIALQNSTRIAADTASQRANAWPSADGNLEIEWRDDYETFITQDLQAANCEFPTPHPDPIFTNANAGDADDEGDHDFGDLVTVRLECEFSLITPLAESILGGPVQMGAESTFPINGLVVVGVPDPPPAPPDPCIAPVADIDSDPAPSAGDRVNGTVSPFTVDFTSATLVNPNPDCPLTYLWERRTLPSGTFTTVGTGEDLDDQVFTDPAGGGNTEYEVRLTATSTAGTDDVVQVVRVSN